MRDLSTEAVRLALRQPGLPLLKFLGKLQRRTSEERQDVARAVLVLLNGQKLMLDKARRIFPNAE